MKRKGGQLDPRVYTKKLAKVATFMGLPLRSQDTFSMTWTDKSAKSELI